MRKCRILKRYELTKWQAFRLWVARKLRRKRDLMGQNGNIRAALVGFKMIKQGADSYEAPVFTRLEEVLVLSRSGFSYDILTVHPESKMGSLHGLKPLAPLGTGTTINKTPGLDPWIVSVHYRGLEKK